MRKTRQEELKGFVTGVSPCIALGEERLKAYEARQKAAIAGEKFYQSTKPCKRGHWGPRLTSTAECIPCRSFNTRSLEGHRAWRFKREYGITLLQYRGMLESQGNRCAICNRYAIHEDALHVDHDHKTKKVRGLLCGTCNQGIGLLREDPDILQGAIDYLKRHGK